MASVRWLAIRDARGWRLGIAPASDEHAGCVDLVAEIPTGYAVLARLTADGERELVAALEAMR